MNVRRAAAAALQEITGRLVRKKRKEKRERNRRAEQSKGGEAENETKSLFHLLENVYEKKTSSFFFQGCIPHGIAVITCADFFSVSNRSDAFLKVAPTIAK